LRLIPSSPSRDATRSEFPRDDSTQHHLCDVSLGELSAAGYFRAVLVLVRIVHYQGRTEALALLVRELFDTPRMVDVFSGE